MRFRTETRTLSPDKSGGNVGEGGGTEVNGKSESELTLPSPITAYQTRDYKSHSPRFGILRPIEDRTSPSRAREVDPAGPDPGLRRD